MTSNGTAERRAARRRIFDTAVGGLCHQRRRFVPRAAASTVITRPLETVRSRRRQPARSSGTGGGSQREAPEQAAAASEKLRNGRRQPARSSGTGGGSQREAPEQAAAASEKLRNRRRQPARSSGTGGGSQSEKLRNRRRQPARKALQHDTLRERHGHTEPAKTDGGSQRARNGRNSVTFRGYPT